MDKVTNEYPALKPWMATHREEFLALFNEYHGCLALGFIKRK